MTIEEALLLIFKEYGLLIAYSATTNIVLWRRIVHLEDKITGVAKDSTVILTKLVSRLEQHDEN